VVDACRAVDKFVERLVLALRRRQQQLYLQVEAEAVRRVTLLQEQQSQLAAEAAQIYRCVKLQKRSGGARFSSPPED
jgi:hypothetical protein